MTGKTCILILGMHRSGTSALTRLCALAGATLPEQVIASRDGNDAGHWESQRLVSFHDDFLKSLNQSWDDFRPLDITAAQKTSYKERFGYIVEQDYGDANLIVMKEPRTARFADLTIDALETKGYTVCPVHALRHPMEVMKSLKARNDIPYALGGLYWLRHVIDTQVALTGRDHQIIDYDQIMQDGPARVRDLFSHFDLTSPPEAFETEADKFIKPSLRHHAVTDWAEAPAFEGWLHRVYAQLRKTAPDPPTAAALKSIRSVDEILTQAADGLHALRHAMGAVLDLTKKAEASESEVNRLQALLETTVAEARGYQKALEDNLTAQRDEVIKLQRTLDATVTDARDYQTKLEKDLKSERREIRTLKGQLTKSKRKNAELEESYKTQVDLLSDQLAHANRQFTDMRQSTSWRVTKPMRRVMSLWRSRRRIAFKLLAGQDAGDLLDNDDPDAVLEASRSPSIRAARKQLQTCRPDVLQSGWMQARHAAPIQDADLPPVTISIVTYNSHTWLDAFLRSVEGLEYPLDRVSLHFVDNGSSDETVIAIENYIEGQADRYRAVTLSQRPNLGYGAGNDWAIRASDDDYVLVTNVDAEFYPDALSQCVRFAISDDADVAAWEFRQTPYEHPKYYDPVTLETNWNAHACVLFRRSAYLAVGGYDQAIFMYGEDVELSYRYRAQGYRLRYVPYAVIHHHVDLVDASKRPHQLSGSTAANVLMRYRYGSYRDIAAGEALLRTAYRHETDPMRRQAFETAMQLVAKSRKHFWRNRISKKQRRALGPIFPFNEFDYDLARPGGDVICPPFKADDDRPLVTIVTRTHGPSNTHLRNVMASVLNQTYPNIEHIIVEDKTDDGRAIVEAAAATFGEDRIRYFKSPGEGRSAGGNYGAAQARGDWLCWLDNDDLLFADHIETLMRSALNAPDAVAAYALAWDAHAEMEDGEPIIHQFELPDSHRQPFDKVRLQVENFIPIQAIIFKRSLFEKHGGFNPDFSQLEDWNLWARYAEIGPFIFTPKVTSLYLTPHDADVREQRQSHLNAAYEEVRRRNMDDIMALRQVVGQRRHGTAKTSSKTAKASTS
jgi:GT2 family glycosyltransferase